MTEAGVDTPGLRVYSKITCPTTERAVAMALDDRGWTSITTRPPDADCLILDPGLACADSFHALHEVFLGLIETLADIVDGFAAARRETRQDTAASVVLVASRDALGTPGAAARSAIAAALIALGRSLALSYASEGMTVNTVVGPARPVEAAAFQAVQLLPNPVAAVNVAEAIAFFADPRSQYVTGQTLYVCGGASMLSSLSV